MLASRSNKGVILALVCLVQFMVVLDIAIVNVALPSIQADLDLAQGTLQWLVTAYGLLLGGFLLLGGRLSDLFGARRVLVVGLVLFSAASLVAGLGQSAGVIIGARGVQGFGAALMAPSALSILVRTFTEGADRNRALGVFGAVGGTSASVGVIASGLLTDGPGWRWVFFINIPVGIALMAMALTLLSKDEPYKQKRRFDTAGAVTVTSSLLTFVYALHRGAEHGWASALTLSLFAASAVLMAIFVMVEARTAEPLFPGRVLKNRTLIVSNTMAFFIFGAFFSFIFLGSLLMQQVLGYSPTRTGVFWLATSVMGFVVAGITGQKLANTVGPQKLLIAGMACLAASVLWLARVPADATYWADLFGPFVLAGISIGLSAVSVQIGALSGVTTSAAGLAAGLVETMREIGGAVAIAAVSTVLISSGREVAQLTDPAAQQATLLDGFQTAFLVTCALAIAGLLLAAFGYPRIKPEGGKETAADTSKAPAKSPRRT